jgi:Flp pilus assembly pilin Flp
VVETTDNPYDERAGRLHGDQGASFVEYALLIACVLVVCLGVLMTFGAENGGLVNGSASTIEESTGP